MEEKQQQFTKPDHFSPVQTNPTSKDGFYLFERAKKFTMYRLPAMIHEFKSLPREGDVQEPKKVFKIVA